MNAEKRAPGPLQYVYGYLQGASEVAESSGDTELSDRLLDAICALEDNAAVNGEDIGLAPEDFNDDA